jgi:hypothetical protein
MLSDYQTHSTPTQQKVQPAHYYRANMTSAEVDEINQAESLALDWQTEAQKTGRSFAIQMAIRYSEECLLIAEKLGVATCVRPFEVTP